MRIAYLGYDRSCLRAAPFLPEEANEILFFLKEPKQDFQFNSFFESDIYADHLLIPGEEKDRTFQAQRKYLSLADQLIKMAQVVSLEKNETSLDKKMDSIQAVQRRNKDSVFDLKSILDIQYDARKKKIILEIEKKGVEEFDLLLTEAHPFLANYFEGRKIKYFKNSVAINYIWSAVNFEIDYLKPLEPFKTRRSFFLVLDGARKTIIDNWFFCHIEKNNMSMWSFQPSHQAGNTEYLNFYVDRIRQNLTEKFKFIHVKNYLNSSYSSVGALQNNVKVRFPQAQCVPNFQFSADIQMNNYFKQKINKKIKVKKKQSGEKYD